MNLIPAFLLLQCLLLLQLSNPHKVDAKAFRSSRIKITCSKDPEQFNLPNAVSLFEYSWLNDNDDDDDFILARKKLPVGRSLSLFHSFQLSTVIAPLKSTPYNYGAAVLSLPDKYIFQRVLRV